MKVDDEIYHPDLGIMKVLDWNDPSLLTVVKKEDEGRTPFKIGKQSGWKRIKEGLEDNFKAYLEGVDMAKEGKPKLSEEEFVVRAIEKLRKPPYKGIHSVYSGFNQAFKKYFGTNPVERTQRLAEEGKIITRPVKGGAMLYLPQDAPQAAGDTLAKILEEE
ncbi:MAG: hypothetical protein JSW70_05800 [Syntrophobacterales bacterium]|nr:MAG: hypothetical protein JSW70_05800 [Syntrophobacterales bacterium]